MTASIDWTVLFMQGFCLVLAALLGKVLSDGIASLFYISQMRVMRMTCLLFYVKCIILDTQLVF